MSDSTIGLVIEKADKPVISVRDLVGMEDDGRADIGIELRNLHFSLILPRSGLKELVEKGVKFLGNEFRPTIRL